MLMVARANPLGVRRDRCRGGDGGIWEGEELPEVFRWLYKREAV